MPTTPIRELDLGHGIDQFHPESKLASGYVTDLVNGLARATGSITKRAGFRRAAGAIPIRVKRYAQENNTAVLTLPDEFDLTGLQQTPIIIAGRTSLTDGEFQSTTKFFYTDGLLTAGIIFSVVGQTITLDVPLSASSPIVDEEPELDIYGLDLLPLTGDTAGDRFSWVNFLAPYVSSTRTGIVAARQGVPYVTEAASEINSVTSATCPSASPTYSATLAAVLGPAFFDAVPVDVPNRGGILATNAGSNTVPVTAAIYDSFTGYTTYRLNLQAHSFIAPATTLAQVIRAGRDYLTVDRASWASLEGRFRVVSVSGIDSDHVDVVVENSANTADDQQHSDTGVVARAGIFSDSANASITAFPVDSLVHSPDNTSFDEAGLSVWAVDASSHTVFGPMPPDPVGSIFGITVTGTFTGHVVPVAGKWVRGDEVLSSADSRLRRVINVLHTGTPQTVAVEGDGTTATCTPSFPIYLLQIGDWISFSRTADFDGEHQVETIDYMVGQFTFASSVVTGSVQTAHVPVSSIGLDEPVLQESGVTTFSVPRRWVAIPSAYNPDLGLQPGTPTTTRAFSQEAYDDQPFISSAHVNRSMYLTNGSDPVKKYDGYTQYDAGIPSLPALLFITRKQSPTGITPPGPNVAYTSHSTYTATVASGDEKLFPIGTRVCVRSDVVGSSDQATQVDAGTNQITISIPTDQSALRLGTAITFSGATPPTGLTAGTTYYVIPVSHTSVVQVIKVAASLTDALAGTAVDITAAGTGTLVTHAEYGYIAGREVFTNIAAQDAGKLTFTDSVSGLPGVTGRVYTAVTLKYYVKYRVVDAQGNLTYSGGVKSQDFLVEFGVPTEIQGSVTQFPLLPDRQLSRVEYEIYRTEGTAGAPPYLLVTSGVMQFTTHNPYINFSDTVQINQLGDFTGTVLGSTDPNSTLRGGIDTGPLFDRPPLAKYAASIDSRLILANLKSPHRMTITIRRKTTTPYVTPQLTSGRFLFQRGTSSPTFFTGPEKFDFGLQSIVQAGIITSIEQSDDYFEVVHSGTTDLTIQRGQWVYLGHRGSPGGERTEIGSEYTGWWIVDEFVSSGRFRVVKPGIGIDVTVTSTNILTPVSGDTSRFQRGQAVYLTGAADVGQMARNYTYYATFSNADMQLNLNQSDSFGTGGTKATSTNGTAFTVRSGDPASFPDSILVGFRSVIPIPAPSYISTGPQIDYAYDVAGANPNSSTQSVEHLVARRLADAINGATVAPENVDYGSDSGVAEDMTGYVPWIYARAGNDEGYATVVVESFDPNEPFTFAYVPGTSLDLVDIYVDGSLLYPAIGSIQDVRTSAQLLYPSRIATSYRNYPEVFGNPYVPAYTSSDAALDVSPDDGQEITGIIPFFGSSFSTAAMQNQQLLVFKSRSAYLVDVRTRQVDFIETHGQGCTFPRSITETRGGIVFANESGIYCIRRDSSIQYLGQFVERAWRALSAPDDSVVGVHDEYRNLVTLSAPVAGEDTNTQSFVYDHTREEAGGAGSWSRFTNQEWASRATYLFDLYSGGYDGRVYMDRQDGVLQDYRDDLEPIEFQADLRPMNFDAPGIRKRIASVVLAFRILATAVGTRLSSAIDLDGVFRFSDEFRIDDPTPDTNLSDRVVGPIKSLLFTVPYQKAEYLQLRITNSTLDEPVELAETIYNIEALTDAGIQQAATTRNPR